MTITANFSLYQNEDVNITETVYASDGVTPLNITGWSISFVVHTSMGVALITKTVGSGITLTNPTNGILTITISKADTSGLNAGVYPYYVARTDSGAYSVLTVGQLTVGSE